MSILVMKFGGTSVADLNKMRNVAAKVQAEVKKGNTSYTTHKNVAYTPPPTLPPAAVLIRSSRLSASLMPWSASSLAAASSRRSSRCLVSALTVVPISLSLARSSCTRFLYVYAAYEQNAMTAKIIAIPTPNCWSLLPHGSHLVV